MKIKGIIDEDFINYKIPNMYIAFPNCTFKCDIDNGCQVCQNWSLTQEPDIEVQKEDLIERYFANGITNAIVCGGLEPMDSELDLLPFIDSFRRQYECDDPIVIYTGYTEKELEEGKFGTKGAPQDTQKAYWEAIKSYKNIVVKFGRYFHNGTPRFEPILGVQLASSNQYAKEYNFNLDENAT